MNAPAVPDDTPQPEPADPVDQHAATAIAMALLTPDSPDLPAEEA